MLTFWFACARGSVDEPLGAFFLLTPGLCSHPHRRGGHRYRCTPQGHPCRGAYLVPPCSRINATSNFSFSNDQRRGTVLIFLAREPLLAGLFVASSLHGQPHEIGSQWWSVTSSRSRFQAFLCRRFFVPLLSSSQARALGVSVALCAAVTAAAAGGWLLLGLPSETRVADVTWNDVTKIADTQRVRFGTDDGSSTRPERPAPAVRLGVVGQLCHGLQRTFCATGPQGDATHCQVRCSMN